MRRGFDRDVFLGILVLAAMMAGIAATSYYNTRQLRDDADRAALSREVIDAVSTVVTDTRRVQAEQRAYLITGFPEWVAPYEEAAARLRADAARLADLTARDPEQHPRALEAGR
ncbi:MAG TPA: CHASE3 domain-containing protein, partial [Urbifossiella sp.]|nr:CHASE3 domain-containing protein [Urbifossiella sp.]